MKKTGYHDHGGLKIIALFAAGLFAFQFVTRALAALTNTASIIVSLGYWKVPLVDLLYYGAAITAGYLLPAKASQRVKLTRATLLLVVLGTSFATALFGTVLNPLLYSLFFAVPGSTSLAAILFNPAYWVYTLGYGSAFTAAFLCIGLVVEFLVKRK